MGVLRRISDGVELPLSARTLLGRAASCTVVLDERYASSEHARIRFTNGRWMLRDLASRNGTFVNGERLDSGQSLALTPGQRLGFGDPEATWEVVSTGAPHIVATDVATGVKRSGLEVLALPDDDAPRLTVFADEQGRWVAEDADGALHDLASSPLVRDGDTTWRIEPPAPADETPMPQVAMTLENVHVELLVSRDEDTAQVVVHLRGIKTPLEPREHAYVLATLARARQEDDTENESDRGWVRVARLLDMLRCDENTLNVWIHRARQQVAAAGVQGAAKIVQVRRGYRRFGARQFSLGLLE
ncbi:MAG: FHA domain-containing protein [Deltaproteobacteria bacterium]|jgi:predicted component of type VI protein secretion system